MNKETERKQINSVVLSLVLALLIVGCGSSSPKQSASVEEETITETVTTEEPAGTVEESVSSNEEPEVEESVSDEPEYYDEQFLEDFSKAIQERWKLSLEYDSLAAEEKDDESEKAILIECVNAEKAIIDENNYRDKPFSDKHIQEDMLVYLNALEEQYELLKESGGDLSDEQYVEWEKLLIKRSKVIVDLYDNYSLPIDAKYITYVNRTHNMYYIEEFGGERAFMNMLNSWTSDEPTELEDGNKQYVYKITNTTPYNFKDLEIMATVDYYTSDGELVDYIVISDKVYSAWDAGETITVPTTWKDIESIANDEGFDLNREDGEYLVAFQYFS